MELLKSLGVNSTLWIQLACFIVSYLAFTTLVLKPYMAALREREKRTVGNEETAVRLIEQTNSLHAEYEKKAKAINSEIKGVYDKTRSEAMKDYDQLVSKAREEATGLLEQSRTEISTAIQKARQTVLAEVPAVSTAIASKLAGKELSL